MLKFQQPILILLLVIIIPACQGLPLPPTEVAQLPQAPTMTPILATFTREPIPSPTFTPLLTATLSATPQLLTATLTALVTSTATPSATLQPLTATPTPTTTPTPTNTVPPTPLHPRSIEVMRQQEYAGSDLVIEETLTPGATYSRYLASYQSEGLKIYALLTIPAEISPETGWPGLVFNHGYIPPAQYRTGERYAAYVDAFARSGYVVLMPDYRGHGDSEGAPAAGYGATEYVIDVLNALGSLKKYPAVDQQRLGMWGHSLGGGLTLRAMVTVPDIKAGVIWAGVVGPYADIINHWTPSTHPAAQAWHNGLLNEYGAAADNTAFWDALSPNAYIATISPIQLHHGTADTHVPLAFSETLAGQLAAAGRNVEFYIYEGDDHNLSQNLRVALDRSVAFFDQHVKKSE